MTRAERRKLLTQAHLIAPDIKSRYDTARIRIVFDDADERVVFCAVNDETENLLATVVVSYEQFDTIKSPLAMNGVYSIVLDKLAEEMDERWMA